jgi:exonuclease SbcD
VRRVEGRFEDVMAGAVADRRREDYLEVTLLDDGPVHDAIGRLRTVYPNTLLAGRRVDFALPPVGSGGAGEMVRLSDDQLFARFFREATGDDLSGEQTVVLADLLEKFARGEEEGHA